MIIVTMFNDEIIMSCAICNPFIYFSSWRNAGLWYIYSTLYLVLVCAYLSSLITFESIDGLSLNLVEKYAI